MPGRQEHSARAAHCGAVGAAHAFQYRDFLHLRYVQKKFIRRVCTLFSYINRFYYSMYMYLPHFNTIAVGALEGQSGLQPTGSKMAHQRAVMFSAREPRSSCFRLSCEMLVRPSSQWCRCCSSDAPALSRCAWLL